MNDQLASQTTRIKWKEPRPVYRALREASVPPVRWLWPAMVVAAVLMLAAVPARILPSQSHSTHSVEHAN